MAADDLSAHVRDLKGAVQAPKQVLIVDELPQTAVGKINKRALSEQVRAAQSPPAP